MPEDERTRECPLCGETMRLKRTEQVLQVPGDTTRVITRTTTEWVCPECDYFEEAEEERA